MLKLGVYTRTCCISSYSFVLSCEEEIITLSGKIAEKTESLQELCVVLTQYLENEKVSIIKLCKL